MQPLRPNTASVRVDRYAAAASYRHRPALINKAVRRGRQLDSGRLEATATAIQVASATGARVEVRFSLPHRVDFGQHVCIVGGHEHLGGWDVVRGVKMTWTEGDVWSAVLELHATDLDLEYKYVVRDESGHAVYWQPGANCSVAVPLETGVPNAVRINDDWWHNHNDVKVDYLEAGPVWDGVTAAPSPAAPPAARSSRPSYRTSPTYRRSSRPSYRSSSPPAPPARAPPTAPEPQQRQASGFASPHTESYYKARQQYGSGMAYQQPAWQQRQQQRQAAGATEEEEELQALASATKRALKNLDATINSSQELLDSLDDSSEQSAFELDRNVAAAARKAMALTKARAATDPSYTRPQLPPSRLTKSE